MSCPPPTQPQFGPILYKNTASHAKSGGQVLRNAGFASRLDFMLCALSSATFRKSRRIIFLAKIQPFSAFCVACLCMYPKHPTYFTYVRVNHGEHLSYMFTARAPRGVHLWLLAAGEMTEFWRFLLFRLVSYLYVTVFYTQFPFF